MGGYIRCGGDGKANCVVVRGDGTRDVVNWKCGDVNVPAVHRVRATLVRYPSQYYVRANYGPEVMAARSESIARLGWKSRSFDLPLPPETVGHFNLLRGAIEGAHKELKGTPTRVRFRYPATVEIVGDQPWQPGFVVYLNLPAIEFYHLLFAVSDASPHPSSHLTIGPADVSTVPKLLAWLRPFETAKKKLYRGNGFDWNPRRGAIEYGPAPGDL